MKRIVTGWTPVLATLLLATKAMGQEAVGGDEFDLTVGGIPHRVHVYTNSGTFEVTADVTADLLVVGGGGGGGGNSTFSSPRASGGGGAGGVISTNIVVLPVGTYAVVVGAGGVGNTNGTGANGGDSSLLHPTQSELQFVAIGGGGGGGRFNNDAAAPGQNGADGGSGGGAGRQAFGGTGVPGQGHDGGSSTADNAGCGGGGAGGDGGIGVNLVKAGDGGVGLLSFIRTLDGEYFAGGGGGAGTTEAKRNTPNGDGGLGGGGAAGVDGQPNTGGGGGGGGVVGTSYSGSGGSGIVVIRYAKSADLPFVQNGPVSNVATTAATFTGYLLSAGSSPATVGVLWGESDGSMDGNWANTNWWAEGAWAEGDYPSTNMTGLTADRTYYYTFAATNAAAGMVAGNPASFITGTVTIQKDSDADETGLTPGAFSVHRPSTATHEAVTVRYACSATSTAAENVNYESLGGEVVLPAGQASAMIVVTPLMDAANDDDTTLTLDLLPGAYALGAGASASMGILNNPVTPQMTNVWIGSGNASVPANWSLGALPFSVTPIRLDQTSTGNMVWDGGVNGLPDTVGSWMQTADYTGVVTVLTTFPAYDAAFTNLTVTGDMTVDGGIVTHATNVFPHADNPTANASHRLRLTVLGNLSIGGGGALDATNCGFLPGSPNANGAASHGGRSSGGKVPYGTPFYPVLPGMGCMTTGSINGPGGGAIHVTVGNALVLDGRIDARGHYPGGGSYIRAGAGGSVLVEAATLSGSGGIHARGWSSDGKSNTGNGAGGRIAVILSQGGFDSFDTAQIDARRGLGGSSSRMGAAGSIYLQAAGEAVGEGTYVIDYFGLEGDLVDDYAHELMAEDYSATRFVLRNLGHLVVSASRTVKQLTADGTANLTVSGTATVLTTERLIVDATEYEVGEYNAVDLPGFLHGDGNVVVTEGPPPPSGTVILLR